MAIRCSRISSLARVIEPSSGGSGGAFGLVGTNQKVSRDFPRFADLVNHLDRERSPTRKNLRRTRARAQKFSQLGLGMAEFVHGIPEHVDRIEGLVDLDRPSLCLVDFDEREEHIKLVALLRTIRRAPTGLDRCERCAVILVCANGPDVHVVSLELRYLQCIDATILCAGADA